VKRLEVLADVARRFLAGRALPNTIGGESLLDWLSGFSGERGDFPHTELALLLDATEQPATTRAFATALRNRIAERL